MTACRALKGRKYNLILFACGAIVLCIFGAKSAWADDAITVKKDNDKTAYTIGPSDEKNNVLDVERDKEKTVYSIGSSKENRDEEARDKERSWDMLMNMGIITDKRQGKTSQSQPSQSQPAQGQPAQPISGK